MEKEKLIDLLFARNESLENGLVRLQATLERQGVESGERMKSLQSQLQRMEERAVAAERRAEEAEKRIAALTAMTDGTVIKDLKDRIVKAEKERDDAKSSDRQNRAERYGYTSQKMRRSRKADGSGDDGNGRDAGEEKSDMGGGDTVKPLPESQDRDSRIDTSCIRCLKAASSTL